MDDENVIVQIEGLEKNYVNQSETLRVLKGLSLTIKKGERVCITGESGNGKSTLLNILGGIDTASGGVVKACVRQKRTAGSNPACSARIFKFGCQPRL